MPNRILKESICYSENIEKLSLFQENFFYRLIVNCDDYGRMDARPKVLASKLFPLRDIRMSQISDALRALSSAELVVLYEKDGHPFLQMKTWDRHQTIRAKKSKFPSPEECIQHLQADEIICKQMKSKESKCSRNPIQSNTNPIRNPDPNPNPYPNPDDDDDVDNARAIQSDHDRVLNAAEDAGFMKSNTVRARLIDLYSDYGIDKVLDGISSCVQHGAPNLAYLEAVLKGGPKKPKRLPAQDYQQRDYTGETEAAYNRMIQEAIENGWLNPEDVKGGT